MEKAYFFQKVMNLHKLPMKELNRKFLILGRRRVGKSRFIQQVYDKLIKDPKFPDKPAVWDHMEHDYILPDDYKYKDYAYVEHNLPKIVGFKTGDLRVFNYEIKKYKLKEEGIKFSDYFKDNETYDHYGVMTLDGKQQESGYPYWRDIRPFENNNKNFQARRENKKFVEVLMNELNKDADIYLMDEIGERFFFDMDIQDRIVELIEDPGKIVIASCEWDWDKEQYDDLTQYTYYHHIRQYQFKEEFILKGDEQNQKLKEEIIERIRRFPKQAEEKFEKVGIYNKRDPIEEMDKWAETQRKDIKWVEKSAKEILEERKNMYKDLSKKEIYEKIGTVDDDGKIPEIKEDKKMDKRVQEAVDKMWKEEEKD